MVIRPHKSTGEYEINTTFKPLNLSSFVSVASLNFFFTTIPFAQTPCFQWFVGFCIKIQHKFFRIFVLYSVSEL